MRAGERASKDFVTVSSGQTVASALAGIGQTRWIVVVAESDLPVGLIEAGQLRMRGSDELLEDIAQAQPSLLMIPEAIEVVDAVRSPAIDELSVETVGAVIMAGNTVSGVWSDADLANAIAQHGVAGRPMSAGDAELPGTIAIPKLVRQCRFAQDQQRCLASLAFPEKPDQLPACPNPKALPPHAFAW